MLKAKVTTTHDWLRVAVTDQGTGRVSLTLGRNGETVSGRGFDSGLAKRALLAFSGLMGRQDGRDNGQKMEALRAFAERSTTIDAYIAGIASV